MQIGPIEVGSGLTNKIRPMPFSHLNHWGSRPDERARPYPCDSWLPQPDESLFRAVTVYASPQLLFRWLCQLRLAPYSYDWIDNLGRTSPRKLVEGSQHLEVGQSVMMIFRLVEFEADRHITIVSKLPVWLFGEVAVTYAVLPEGDHSRLVVKLQVRHPRGPLGWLSRLAFAPADWIMMRKQLLTLKGLAQERHGRFESQRSPGHWLHYVEAGKPGNPLLLMIHGGSGNWSNYRAQVAEFARDYHVFAPDMRGHGASPWPGPCRIDDFYSDIEEFAEWIGQPFELVAHSFGGYMAVRLAATHPDWVRHLALINTGPYIPHGKRFYLLKWACSWADWIASPEGVIAAGREVCDHLTRHVLKEWDCRTFYGKITCPSLVVLGGLDPLISLRLGKIGAEMLPNSQLQILPLAGHVAMWDHPQVINRLLRQLFSR